MVCDGCEARTPYCRHIWRLDQFHMRCLRRDNKYSAAHKMVSNITSSVYKVTLVGTPCEDGRWPHPQGRVLWRTGRRSLNMGSTTKEVQRCAQGNTEVMQCTPQHLGGHHDRPLWRSTCHSSLRDYEEKSCDALRDKRMRWKAIQPSSNIDIFLCHVCGQLCPSQIGLHSHNQTHATDGGRDPSYNGDTWISVPKRLW